MPSSRRSRESIKQGKTVTAAEWRLRADMGAEMPVDEAYISPTARERMRRDREQLRAAFAELPLAERKRNADSFKSKLRAVCPSRRAHQGAWDAMFAPQLRAAPRDEHPAQARIAASPSANKPHPSSSRPPQARMPASNSASKAQPSSPRPPKPAAMASHRTRVQAIPPQAARALDVKLRVAASNSDAAITRLTRELNRDRHFLAAFGGTLTEQHIRDALTTIGQYRSGGAKERKKK